jgi:anti-sigma regulatory factor (Ser/Thr protein kinase)
VCSASPGHHAFLYQDDDALIGEVVAFARSGLEDDEHVVVALEQGKVRQVEGQLGSDGAGVEFLEASRLYDRHGEMFASIVGRLERHRGKVRVVAEQALGRRAPVDVRAYMRYEAASTLAYEAYGASVACPYDAGRLPAGILEAALRTHPAILDNGRSRPSEAYVDPRDFVREHVQLARPPAGVEPYELTRLEEIAGVRTLVRERAGAEGLGGQAVDDLCTAVSEVAANAFLHGAAPRQLRIFVADDQLVCQVGDGGAGLADPLAGYLPPPSGQIGGRGLWIAHQLCDVVEVASNGGNCVSLHMRL